MTNDPNILPARRKFFVALAPREKWTPSQWAENCRVLGSDVSSEPGRWKNDRTPYLADILDALIEPGVEEILVLKGAQIGWSEATRNALGYWIDLDPGPCLVVAPNQKAAEDWIEETVKPLLKDTPAVARHVTARSWDVKKAAIRFDTMRLFMGWAGSSQSVKSRPIRYLILEEPDEFISQSGSGGDPIAKAVKRLTTYSDKGRARVLIGGTPTTRRGNIWKRWESCPQRRFMHVPCPHCGKHQRLEWAGVRWPKIEGTRQQQSERVLSENLAHYECEFCKAEIRDHHKPGMLRRRVWATEDQVVTDDGRVAGPRPPSSRVAFFVSSLYSPWATFSKLASEWLAAQDDPNTLRDFINQRLAETFEPVASEVKLTVLEEKANGAPPALIVPTWAVRLIATADTQGLGELHGHFAFTIRAWGTAWHSQLIDAGILSTKEELIHAVFARGFQLAESEQQIQTQFLLIDSGGPRWQEIYSLAQAHPHHIKPSKGANRKLAWMVDKRHQKNHNVILWEVDSQQAKDQLHHLVHNQDRSLWLLNDRIPGDYLKQLTAEHKVLGKDGTEIWQSKPGKPANHFLDCEALQVAAAWEQGCGIAAPPPTPPPQPTAPPQQQTRPQVPSFMRGLKPPEWFKRS